MTMTRCLLRERGNSQICSSNNQNTQHRPPTHPYSACTTTHVLFPIPSLSFTAFLCSDTRAASGFEGASHALTFTCPHVPGLIHLPSSPSSRPPLLPPTTQHGRLARTLQPSEEPRRLFQRSAGPATPVSPFHLGSTSAPLVPTTLRLVTSILASHPHSQPSTPLGCHEPQPHSCPR